MRVLHVIDSLASHGAEKSLVALAPHLRRRGITYEVAFLRDPDELGPALLSQNIRVHDLRGDDSRAAHTERIGMLLLGLQPDLVHTTLYRSDVAGRAAAHAAGLPSVTTWASTGPTHGSPLLQLKRTRTDAIDRWTARHATRFHAVSQPVADVVGERLRIDPDRIDVIPRGRNPQQLGQRSPDRRRLVRSKLGIGETPLLLALARHEPAKGLDSLIEATATLRGLHPRLRLLIAGDHGSQTDLLRRRIRDLDLASTVSLLGQRTDIGDLLSAADLCVAPSLVEGFPGTVVEASLVGTPLVVTDLPTIRAAVPTSDLALFARPNDPLDLASRIDEGLQQRSASLARARLARRHARAHFSLAGVADATIAFYERACSQQQVPTK